MTLSIRPFVALAALVLLTGPLPAEVPPLRDDTLKADAAVIVTGTVTEVKAGKEKARSDGTETEYRLTVRVANVEKGKLKEGVKAVVARGRSIRLKPGFSGSGGHYDARTWDRMPDVRKGWELKLYLKGPKDGAYDILFPNGFKVLKKTPEQEGK